MRMSRAWVTVAMLAAACGDDAGPSDDAGGRDGAAPDGAAGDGGGDASSADAGGRDASTDGSAGADATTDGSAADGGRPSGFVACGGMECDGPEFCCTTDRGASGSCGSFPEGCGAGVPRFICDGPEDCADSAECCFTMASSVCLPDGDCDRVGAPRLCHDDTHCAGGRCCPLGAGSPYSSCTPDPSCP